MFPTQNAPFAARLALALALTFVGASAARAEEPPKKDDALDRLLEKLDEAPAPGAKPATEPPDAPKPAEAEAAKARPGADKEPAKGNGKGDVAPKDQALDSLLEKLGETQDRPEAKDERRAGPSMPGEDKDKEKDKDTAEGGKGNEPMPPKADELSGRDKGIDERLEEITGRKRKKKGEDEEQGGPLSQVIKEMREGEKRLSEPDTGEETRKKQGEIVKNLDQLIEQMKNSSAQSKGQKTRLVNMPGQKPGSQQPGQDPGSNPGQAPNMKPSKPESKHALANGKDEWGHLPPELRQEMDNVARETMLPSKEELIKRYYLSVSKKSLVREE